MKCATCALEIELDDEYGDWFVQGMSWPDDMSCGGDASLPHMPELEVA